MLLKKIMIITILSGLLVGCASTDPVKIDPEMTADEASKKLFDIVMKEAYDLNLVKRYVRAGADVNYIHPEIKESTFLNAVGFYQGSGQLDVIDYMLDEGANAHFSSGNGTTPLHAAVANNEAEVVQRIIDAGAILNAQNESGRTAVHEAIRDGSQSTESTTLGVLIAAGADVNIPDRYGQTPIFIASQLISNPITSLKQLITAKADVNVSDQDGHTPLHLAASRVNGTEETIVALLNAGADVNARNKEGQTPLHIAVRNERERVMWVLIAAGADVNRKDRTGATPRSLAEKSTNQELLNILNVRN